jgi:hypothetical protein
MMRWALGVVVLIMLGMQHVTSKSQEEMSEDVAALHRALFEVRDDKTLGDPALWRELAIRYLDAEASNGTLFRVARCCRVPTVRRGRLATTK